MGPKEQALRALVASRGLRYVGTRGNLRGLACFVGEAPGADEEAEGKPFVGKSGKEADRMLAEAGFAQDDLWFTNPFKVRPPDNKLERWSELGIPKEPFIEQFIEELSEYKPTIIIVAGATPLSILCSQTLSRRDGEAKIGQWRGSLLSSSLLEWPHYIIPVYHPAFILREWSERQVTVLCLARAAEELAYYKQNGKLQPLTERELITEPTYATVIDYLQSSLTQREAVSIDIELLKGCLPYTISIAKSPRSAISFSFWDYDTKQLVEIWKLLDEVLRTKPQIGQNYLGFDCVWLEFLGFSPKPNLVDDTMIRHHVLWPEFEHKLQFQTLQYTREPFYKDEGRLWKPSEGKKKLQIYNCKDSAVTCEIFLEQEKDFSDRPHLRSFYLDYEMRLARHFHSIEKRGILVDPSRLEALRRYIGEELEKSCKSASQIINRTVVSSKEFVVNGDELNLNSPTQLLAEFKRLGLRVPIKRGTGRESTGEEQLNKMFAETGHPVLKEILRVRELNKILGTYVNCKLANNVLYCSYVVTGTVTGRRSSRTNIFGLGTNHQNQPKHSDLGHRFRECLVARSGRVFVGCDQKGAEDWIVQGIIADQGGDAKGLNELRAGINRHRKLAAFLFQKPEAECHKESMLYFMGKKTRHAANYDMQAERLSGELAKEGFHVAKEHCAWLLMKFHEYEPSIKGVYHAYIQRELMDKRRLVTPLGRERIFFGLRPFADNSSIFRDGYAQIPQSTVGDNTGLAIIYCEENAARLGLKSSVIMDTHDAIMLEVEDNNTEIINAVRLLAAAFDRTLRFPKGLELKIPIEVEVGYNMNQMLTCQDHSSDRGLTNTLTTLRSQPRVPDVTTGGLVQQSSPQHSSATFG